MATQSRRSSFSSSQFSSALSSLISSSMAKRHLGLENPGKSMAAKPKLAKKRPTLANLMNQTNGSLNAPRAVVVSKKPVVPCEVNIAKMKKESSTLSHNKSIYENLLPTSCNVKSRTNVSCQDTCFQRADQPAVSITASSGMDVSPSKSDGGSVSLDETMSTCDFLRSPEFEYIDNDDALAVNSIERKACSSLDISDPEGIAGNICKRDILVEIKTVDRVVGIDDNVTDPQLCATIACEIYKNLQASERKKMPRTDLVERIQGDINASMRAILIDWLVEVAEEYCLVPETLFLTVNYIDRYLSGNVIQRQQIQLLGVACMMIAAKYEESCAPQVEEFCYVTDNTYFKKEVLQMESSVLNYLKFEMSAPTAGCFLTRFVRAAQGINEVPSMQLGYLANYLTELSLLEYGMLCYAPSLIAASAIFLAKFILNPSKRPWTLTLRHYTLYKPSDLRDCVKAIHRLVCNIHSSSLPAIREKYSQHKVAEEYCLVPETLFLTVNYIDRYLSGNVIQRQQIQLLGVACMMIAAKYEESCAPQVEEFCYVTDNTYFKKEVLQMESSVLNYLKFEMSAPTAGCFLTRFVRAAQGINEVPSMQLGYLANYLTELSLLEYGMLCYAPSLIAASAIFLAKFILNPSKRPWTLTLRHYTLYKPSDLRDCVKAIHRLVCNIHSSSLPAIREKYSQHKYKFVAKKNCPSSVPQEFFIDLSD